VRNILYLTALMVFVGVALLLWFAIGNRLLLGTNDEGIYLDAAQRILHGQKPYVDFFGYMAPGSFWVEALSLRLFGETVAAGRLPVLLYFAAQCALLYWLVARLTSVGPAVLAVFLYFSFQTADLTLLTAQHRWDSSALSLAAIATGLEGQLQRRKGWFVASGALIVLSVIFTPSVGLVAVITLSWLVLKRELRFAIAPYLIGATLMGGVLIAALYANGILFALAAQLSWLSKNYSGVNVMPYGAIIGGYRALLEGSGAEFVLRASIIFCIALPAILPVLSVVACLFLVWRHMSRHVSRPEKGAPEVRDSFIYLTACSCALVFSTYPRPDVIHLAYIAPLPYALGAVACVFLLGSGARLALTIFLSLFAAIFFWNTSRAVLHTTSIATPAGIVRVSPAEQPYVESLLVSVKPGDSLFVYPYRPLLYFLTAGNNPTRYSYLMPGMMTAIDEQSALTDLRRSPPEWLLFADLPLSEYLRVFPGADSKRLHLAGLEQWIRQNYSDATSPPISIVGYTVMRRTVTRPISFVQDK
jgi:4-amino-4-deoxy-L-arabinose transferase-like glycosyltransferase